MFKIDQQLGEFKTLLCQMSRQLDVIAALLQKLVDQEQVTGNCNSYTVTIDEAAWREWQGQHADHD